MTTNVVYQFFPLTEEFRRHKVIALGDGNNLSSYRINIDVSTLFSHNIIRVIGVFINGIFYTEEVEYDHYCITIRNVVMKDINYEIAILCESNKKNRNCYEVKNIHVDQFGVRDTDDGYALTVLDSIESYDILGIFVNSVLYSTPPEIDLSKFNISNPVATFKHFKPVTTDKVEVLVKI